MPKGLVVMGAVMGAAFLVGSLCFASRSGWPMKVLGTGTGVLMLLCAGVLAQRMAWGQRSEAEASALPLPDDLPEEFHRLGPPTTVFGGESTSSSIVLILIGTVFLAFAVVAVIAVLTTREPGRMLELAVVAPMAGVAAIFMGVRNLLFRLTIVIFPDGLAEVCNGRVRICRWEQIDSVTRNLDESSERPSWAVCRLRLCDGEQMVFKASRVERLDQLSAQIEAAVAPDQLAQALDTLTAGGTVPFGPLEISAAGIAKGSKLLRWEDCETFRVEKGRLQVYQNGTGWKWCNVPFSELPNAQVLLKLLREHNSFATIDG